MQVVYINYRVNAGSFPSGSFQFASSNGSRALTFGRSNGHIGEISSNQNQTQKIGILAYPIKFLIGNIYAKYIPCSESIIQGSGLHSMKGT